MYTEDLLIQLVDGCKLCGVYLIHLCPVTLILFDLENRSSSKERVYHSAQCIVRVYLHITAFTYLGFSFNIVIKYHWWGLVFNHDYDYLPKEMCENTVCQVRAEYLWGLIEKFVMEKSKGIFSSASRLQL